MTELQKYNEKIFESIKHIDENGNEYWEARELQEVLEYAQWRRFNEVINRAIISCKISGNDSDEHFANVGKPIKGGNGNIQIVKDYKLSRYACYLIVQNANPQKETVALGQTYFAVQTRKMEITEEEFSKLSEDEKRLYTRINVKNKNKFLFDTAKKAGVKNFGKFNDYGYKGLYNGETAKQIAERKGIDSEKEEILDYMGSTELAANLFRITQTDDVLKIKNVDNEDDACQTHHNVGKAVRKTIKEIGGIMPENLPTPKKSIKQLEKEEYKKISS